MPTTDVGGGVQLVDFQKSLGDPLETAQKQLSLVDLANKIQAAPVDLQIKKIDQALKGNQLLMTDIANETSRVELISKKNTEARAQTTFLTNQMQELPKLAAIAPEFAAATAQRMGLNTADNKDGTMTIFAPGANGAVKAFTLDPRNVAPEKRPDMEKNLRQEWDTATKNFSVQSQYYSNMKGLSQLGTAQGDIGIIFSYMKLLDPSSSVREGEQASARNAPGVSERVINMYNRAISGDAPFFGAKGSLSRQKFVDAARVLHDDAQAGAEKTGKFLLQVAENGKLDPRNVINPVGNISYESLTGQPPPQPPAGTGTKPTTLKTPGSGAPPSTNDASLLPSRRAAPQAAAEPPQPPIQLNSLTGNWLQNLQKNNRRKP